MRTACLVTATVSVLLLAACGSESKDSTLSRAEAVKEANAICREATTAITAYVADTAAPSGDAATIAALEQDVNTANTMSKKLDALRLPDEQRADFDRFTQGVRDFAESNGTFITAIKGKDRRGVVVGSDGAVKAGKLAEDAAKAYGLTDCPPPTTATAFANKDKAPAPEEAPAVDPIGSWSGTVTQVNADGKRYRYEAFMTVTGVSDVGAVSGTVRYPSFPCSGNIIYLRSDGDRFFFRERITAREDKCPSGGRIRATVSGDQMAWRWLRGTIKVAGILKRR